MTDETRIRVLLVDDHSLVREGLRSIIHTQPDMVVVGEAADGTEVANKIEELQPDILLMDMVMPRQDGLATIEQLRERGTSVRIIVLASFADDSKIFPAIKAGAQGYLLKDIKPNDLIQSIRDVHHGESSLHPSIARMLMAELMNESNLPPTEDPLTDREMDVLKLIASGYTNLEIADQLVISEGTIRKHVSRILDKLHLANRTQAAIYALRQGLASLDPEQE
jgi:NarL family two-component system response regulator LiaR